MRFFIVNVPAVEGTGTTTHKRKRDDADESYAEDDHEGDGAADVDSDTEALDAKTRLETFIQVCTRALAMTCATNTNGLSAQLHGGTVHAGQSPRNSDTVVHTRDMTDEEAAKWAYGPPCAQVRLGDGCAVQHPKPALLQLSYIAACVKAKGPVVRIRAMHLTRSLEYSRLRS
jgi:hypothetical protein